MFERIKELLTKPLVVPSGSQAKSKKMARVVELYKADPMNDPIL